MVIGEIKLKDFRNFKHYNFEAHPKLNFICGRNGAGKTNLLESIYYISHLKSFRTKTSRYLINSDSGGNCAKILSEFKIDSIQHEIDIAITGNGKTVTLDGKVLKYSSNYLSDIYSVLIATDLFVDFKNNPKAKRKFFDRFCVRIYPEFVDLIKEQTGITGSKNSLIRENRLSQIPLWNDLLVKNSKKIFEFRKKLVNEINQFLSSFYKALTEKKDKLLLRYRSDLRHEDFEEKEIVENLKKKMNNEVSMGFRIYGPHRDLFWFEIEGKSEKIGFSQGEFKSSFLSLQLTLNKVLENLEKDKPILLLDDIFSELDEVASEKIMNLFQERRNQIFVTNATDMKLDNKEYLKIDPSI